MNPTTQNPEKQEQRPRKFTKDLQRFFIAIIASFPLVASCGKPIDVENSSPRVVLINKATLPDLQSMKEIKESSERKFPRVLIYKGLEGKYFVNQEVAEEGGLSFVKVVNALASSNPDEELRRISDEEFTNIYNHLNNTTTKESQILQGFFNLGIDSVPLDRLKALNIRLNSIRDKDTRKGYEQLQENYMKEGARGWTIAVNHLRLIEKEKPELVNLFERVTPVKANEIKLIIDNFDNNKYSKADLEAMYIIILGSNLSDNSFTLKASLPTLGSLTKELKLKIEKKLGISSNTSISEFSIYKEPEYIKLVKPNREQLNELAKIARDVGINEKGIQRILSRGTILVRFDDHKQVINTNISGNFIGLYTSDFISCQAHNEYSTAIEITYDCALHELTHGLMLDSESFILKFSNDLVINNPINSSRYLKYRDLTEQILYTNGYINFGSFQTSYTNLLGKITPSENIPGTVRVGSLNVSPTREFFASLVVGLKHFYPDEVPPEILSILSEWYDLSKIMKIRNNHSSDINFSQGLPQNINRRDRKYYIDIIRERQGLKK